MEIIKPQHLRPGDSVGIVAPSNAVDIADMRRSIEIIEHWGLKVKIGEHVEKRVYDFSAGTGAERMADLKLMMFDPEIKMIWAADGGYAASEVLPMFTPDLIELVPQNPKLFLGYSDVCTILNALTSIGLVSLMGPNVWGFREWDEDTIELTRRVIFGDQPFGIGEDAHWLSVAQGVAEGRLICSNLDTLLFSFGTWFDPLEALDEPVILAIEELDIEKSALQRMIDSLLNHRRAHRIKGIVVGRLTNITEHTYCEWGKQQPAEKLIAERVKVFGIPLAFCQDFGHPEWEYPVSAPGESSAINRRFIPLPNAIKARLSVYERVATLEFLEPITVSRRTEVTSNPSPTQNSNLARNKHGKTESHGSL